MKRRADDTDGDITDDRSATKSRRTRSSTKPKIEESPIKTDKQGHKTNKTTMTDKTTTDKTSKADKPIKTTKTTTDKTSKAGKPIKTAKTIKTEKTTTDTTTTDEVIKKDKPIKAEDDRLADFKPNVSDLASTKAQFSKTKNLIIPVDESCSLTGYCVYVDDAGIIYDAALNQTNSGHNNNKFYRIQVLTDGNGKFYTWTRWGRVGVLGQSKVLGAGDIDSAVAAFAKKFSDKSDLAWADRNEQPKSGKYVFVERSYEPDSDHDSDHNHDDSDDNESSIKKESKPDRRKSFDCTLSDSVRSLVELMFNQQYMSYTMADLNYDANKLPLGKLSKNTITRGFATLKQLSEILADDDRITSHPGDVEALSNRYYSYIPHNFGFKAAPVIRTLHALRREVELLESLTDLKDADAMFSLEYKSDTIHHFDRLYNGLHLQEMTPLDPKTDEYIKISEYLNKTSSVHHSRTYDVQAIFRVQRKGEFERFDACHSTPVDRRLLWHGSRSTNFAGILSQGLRIAPPEAPANGYMFGKGIYLADASSKSANYCASHNSGGHGLLLLCEAELGSPMQELKDASYTADEEAKKSGLLSTLGLGMRGPKAWIDAKGVHSSLTGVRMPDPANALEVTNLPGVALLHNEYIAYDVSQVRLRYLLRVKM